MKKILFLLALGLLLSANSHSQNAPSWTQTMNVAPDPDYLFPVASQVDWNGDVVVLCTQSAQATVDTKIFLRRYDSSGNILWTTVFTNGGLDSPRGFDLVLDSSGNSYVAGGFMQSGEPLLIKFDNAGSAVWQRSVISAFPLGALNQIVFKNALLYMQSASGVAVFDVNGTEQWSVASFVKRIAVDHQGRMIASVSSGFETLVRYNADGSFSFSDSTIQAARIAVDNNDDIYLLNDYGTYAIASYDSSGTFKWIHDGLAPTPPFGDIGIELLTDYNNDVIAIGLNDTMMKFTSSGSFLWKKSMNGLDQYILNAGIYGMNYILIAGAIPGSVSTDVRVATFDLLGNQNWSGEYNSNNTQEFPVSMCFDNGFIYVMEDSISNSTLLQFDSPFFSTPIDYNLICVDSVWYEPGNPLLINVRVFNGNISNLNYPSVQMISPLGDTISNRYNLVNFFAHLGNTTQIYQDTISEAGITDFSGYSFAISEGFGDTTVAIGFCLTSNIVDIDNEKILLYPNPATDKIHFSMLPENESFHANIYDVNLKLCGHAELDSKQTSLSVSGLARGMYFIQLKGESHILNFKVMKD